MLFVWLNESNHHPWLKSGKVSLALLVKLAMGKAYLGAWIDAKG